MEEIFGCGMCDESFSELCALCKHLIERHVANFKNTETVTNANALQPTDDFEQSPQIVDPTVSSRVIDDNSEEIVSSNVCVIKAQEHSSKISTPSFEEVCRFVCFYCSKKCMTKFELEKHERTHTKERPFHCDVCSKAYQCSSSLHKHMKRKHYFAKTRTNTNRNSKGTIMCSFCGKVLQTRSSLRMHERIHTGEKPFQCFECKSSFNTRGGCCAHMRRVHKKEPFMLAPRLLRVDNVEKHAMGSEENINELVDADTGIVVEKNTLNLNNHNHGFKSDSSTVNSNSDKNDQKLFKCPYCSETWKRNSDLIEHVRYHTGEKPFNCHICSRPFYRRCILNNHILEVHGEASFKQKVRKPIHKCPYCSKAWAKKSELEKHMRHHTGEKPYACPGCPKSFYSSGQLSAHIRMIHDWESLKDQYKQVLQQVNERKHKSGSIPDLSLNDVSLNGVMEANYTESELERKKVENVPVKRKRYARDSMNLVYYKHKCSFCDKSWKTPSALKIHERTHTREKPFQCSECQKCFSTRGSVYSHIRRSHRKEPSLKKVKIFKVGNTEWHGINDSAVSITENVAKESDLVSKEDKLVPDVPLNEEEVSDTDSPVTLNGVMEANYTESELGRKNVGNVPVKRKRSTRESMNLVYYKHKCSFCDKSWKTPSALKIHERTHTREKPFQCSECQKCFSSRGSVYSHIRRSHRKEPSLKKAKIFKVGNTEWHGINDSAVSINENVAKESDLVSKEDKLVPVVPLNEEEVSDTDSPMTQKLDGNHKNENEWKCPLCPKGWKRLCDLIKHMRCHTGEKPYKCSACPKAFINVTLLRYHFEAHHDGDREMCFLISTPQGSLKCPYCPETWNYPLDLINHVKLCHRGFRTSGKLKNKPEDILVKDSEERERLDITPVGNNNSDLGKGSVDVSANSYSLRERPKRVVTKNKRKTLKAVSSGSCSEKPWFSNGPQRRQNRATIETQTEEALLLDCTSENHEDAFAKKNTSFDEENVFNPTIEPEPDVPFVENEREALKESSVSIVDCAHSLGLGDISNHSSVVCNGSSSHSSKSLKVIKIKYKGQVKLFTIQPFDCSKCVNGGVAPGCTRTRIDNDNDNQQTFNTEASAVTILDHPNNECLSNCNSQANTNESNFNRSLQLIAQSQAFQKEIHEIMTNDASSTQDSHVVNREHGDIASELNIDIEPAEVIICSTDTP